MTNMTNILLEGAAAMVKSRFRGYFVIRQGRAGGGGAAMAG
ncbi:MAG: hypothetical protein Q7T45_00265 [Bradyrhizobium sp.]|nr:hypothetical protein [Bradyrhizobium sp.]MDO8396233.1 hypothetical protein [Bradyrhizobium sp.]